MRMAPEGWPFIAIGWALAALSTWGALRWGGWLWGPAGALALVAMWLLVFFRDPARPGPRGDVYVIAPADGKIVSVAEVEEPMFLKARARRVSIFMNVLNVHVNRYPVTGRVELVHYNPGKFLHAAAEKASLDNEQSSIGIAGPHGPVLVRQIAGQIARRIVTDTKPGDPAMQGERLGMIRFGSRVDVFLPLSARPVIKVVPGEHVLAGTSILAVYEL
ncbi:MAG: phosphatidylserine decarboxylase family protein [Gemmatimonadetes bacterium]|nr:phosphatidylserine decarboxylase family protein [Gemmatimonadota bacterium]